MAPTNRFNKPLHWLLGFCLQFGNGLLYANRREDRQLPPENNRHPGIRIRMHKDGSVSGAWWKPEKDRGTFPLHYWSAVRVRDILSDLKEVNQGATAGWFFEKALWLWLGYKLAGLI